MQEDRILEGINKTLYEWMIGSDFIKLMTQEETDVYSMIINIFGQDAEEREVASTEFYKKIWKNYPEFGPNPMIDILAEYEHNRVFYQNYRDHTTHIVKTFILGLYFYDNVRFIRESIDNYLDTSKEKYEAFLKTWIISALYHDIGYIFENYEIEKYGPEWEMFKYSINEMLGSPMTCLFSNRGITKDKERKFIKSNKIFVQNIDYIGEIDAVNEENKREWDILIDGGVLSNLVDDKSINGIQKYYEFTLKKSTIDGRHGYMDHGICSALLLNKVWYAYFDYINSIVTQDYNLQSLKPLKISELKQLFEKIKQIENLVSIASNAIALHNINKEENVEEATTYGICLNDFKLKFSDMPFACLLRICDEMQMWDRGKFRRPYLEDVSLKGRDVDIYADEMGIYLEIKQDTKYREPEKNKESIYNKVYRKLQLYLDEGELRNILKYGKPEDIAFEKKIETDFGDGLLDGITTEFRTEDISIDYSKINWLLGAVNLDEDVHFSSFYLNQSMDKNLPEELQGFGYHNLIAVYRDYNEMYYLPQEECVGTAERLIDYSLKNWMFWEEVIKKINERIENLENVFKKLPKQGAFTNLSLKELSDYYEEHYQAHTDLYTYARIPEVLDRGVPTFTTFLKKYLRGKNEELKEEKKLNEVFDALTYPETIAYSGEEVLDCCEIIRLINELSSEEDKERWKASNGRFLIRMRPEIVRKIEEYTQKWTFWGYHGYRNRVLRDLNYFAEKFRLELSNKELEEQERTLIRKQERAAISRARMFAKYNIEEKYQMLFRVYSKIGIIKLKRRYYQLINFYYLDQLLFEIAKHYEVSESVIRCMTPDEVIELLRGNRDVLEKGLEREKAKLFILHLSDATNEIVCGDEAERIVQEVEKMMVSENTACGELKGETASLGTYRGVCRIIGKEDDIAFAKGEILVATDIDPDKFELLKLAGAVITETGGFTCHAAIVCRELQKPCIVGIYELTKFIHTGQQIYVDADHGIVKIIESKNKAILRASDEGISQMTIQEIGAKAYSLIRMKNNGFSVPEFFCVRIDALKEIFLRETDYSEQISNSLILDIQNTLDELDTEWWAIRSSTNREDGVEISGAGQEVTMLRVHKTDVIQDLYRITNGLKDYAGKGSIIIQRMILGSCSGIIFTSNPIGNSKDLVIQAVPGGCEYLTNGQTNPITYVYKKDSRFFEEPKKDIWKNILSEDLKENLKNQAMTIEKFFGVPQDIEWTIQANHIYFLQSRAITGGNKKAEESIFSGKKSLVIDTLSIYQAYALPIHLRDHMLKTTAIVCWILDHWKGEKLDEEVMIQASLLHDIGNIVKGTNEKFKIIFPDFISEESWQYWLNVRQHIEERYGKTDLDATLNIAKEINVNSKVLKLIERKQFGNNEQIYKGKDYEAKICAYADQRVSPNGILSLQGRLDEARTRHRGIPDSSVNAPNYEKLKKYAVEIEKQVFGFVEGHPEDINDTAVEQYIFGLKLYEFK